MEDLRDSGVVSGGPSALNKKMSRSSLMRLTGW